MSERPTIQSLIAERYKLQADLVAARADAEKRVSKLKETCAYWMSVTDGAEKERDKLKADLAVARALLLQVDKKSRAQLSEWYEFIDEIKAALAGKDAT